MLTQSCHLGLWAEKTLMVICYQYSLKPLLLQKLVIVVLTCGHDCFLSFFLLLVLASPTKQLDRPFQNFF